MLKNLKILWSDQFGHCSFEHPKKRTPWSVRSRHSATISDSLPLSCPRHRQNLSLSAVPAARRAMRGPNCIYPNNPSPQISHRTTATPPTPRPTLPQLGTLKISPLPIPLQTFPPVPLCQLQVPSHITPTISRRHRSRSPPPPILLSLPYHDRPDTVRRSSVRDLRRRRDPNGRANLHGDEAPWSRPLRRLRHNPRSASREAGVHRAQGDLACVRVQHPPR